MAIRDHDVKQLMEEPALKQVTVWARGVLQNKEARDVVVILCNSAWKAEGKYVQAYENYVDLPDRIYVPVRAYARVSDGPIETKYIYENEDPAIVVLTEETLIKGNYLAEGPSANKTLIVNSKRSPKEVAKFLPKDQLDKFSQIVTVDAFGMAEAVVTLDGAEGTYDKSGIGVGISAALVGAIVKATGFQEFENVAAQLVNKEALKKGYEECQIADVASVA
jgi:oxalate oxidoreductase subunit delta